MALLAVETANGFNGRPRAAGRTMPVECMSGKSAFLAAIAWFAAHLLTNHVSQHPKAFFRPPFFRFVEMVVHQLREDAHGRVAFQPVSYTHLPWSFASSGRTPRSSGIWPPTMRQLPLPNMPPA